MKKMRGMILAGLLLCAVMALGFLPGGIRHAEAEDGIEITGDMNAASGNGWTYAPASSGTDQNTLTLTNCSIPYINYTGNKSLEIILEGKNTISGSGSFSGIYSNKALKISGSGSLNVTAEYEGIYVTDNAYFMLDGATLTINMYNRTLQADGIRASNIYINTGSLIVSIFGNGIEQYGIKAKNMIIKETVSYVEISSSTSATESGNRIKSAIPGIAFDSTDVYTIIGTSDNSFTYSEKNLVFMPNINLWVGGTQVNGSNMHNIIPASDSYTQYSGKASYDYLTNTLTLNNYKYTGEGYYYKHSTDGNDRCRAAICYTKRGTLNIKLVGDSTVIQSGENDVDRKAGIYSSGGLSITGGGNLGAQGGACSSGLQESNGIFVYKGDLTVDNNGGTITASGDTTTFSSCGIDVYSSNTKLTIKSGTVTGTGKGSNNSYGIYTYNTEITGGAVIAEGGGAEQVSYGVRANTISITGGTITASAGSVTKQPVNDSYGIKGTVITIGDKVTFVEASGENKAISCNNVTTSLPGIGWPESDQTGTVYPIKASNTAQELKSGDVYFKSVHLEPASNLVVGGIYVYECNAGNITGSDPKQAYYDPTGNTLTLNNYNYTGEGYAYTYDYTDAAICYTNQSGTLTIFLNGNNNTVIQSGGSSSIKAGIFSAGGLKITGSGNLTASGGTANVESYGIRCTKALELSGTGVLSATGGEAEGSFGILQIISSYSLTIKSGTVIAEGAGGNSVYSSNGIYTQSELNIQGGSITAKGMAATDSSKGIYGCPVNITGGSVTAAAGVAKKSFGVWSDHASRTITIGPDVTYAEFRGETSAAYSETNYPENDNKVLTAIPGFAWLSTAETGTKYEIPAKNEAQILKSSDGEYYKKVTFHDHHFTYALSDTDNATIVATCSNTATCPLTNYTATLILAAPLHTQYGDGKAAAAGVTDADGIQGEAKVRYYKAKDNGTADGDALSAAPVDAGKYRAEITLYNGTNPVTAFVVYEISPASLTVTTGSASKTYDGTPLTCEDAGITGLAAGETAAVTATGSQTNAGSGTNTYSIEWNTAKESNYSITENLGTLTVNPKAVTVTAKDQTITEDESIAAGTANAELSGALAGHTLSAVTLAVNGDGKIEASEAVISDAAGNPVTANYDITYETGILTVRKAITRKVTFKVVNGSWDDGTTEKDPVILEGYEGDVLKLSAEQIPTAGTKPAEGYKEGSWERVPDPKNEITADTTYIYTYIEKDKISQKVTFRVVNGSWDDGTTEDIVVTLQGLEGDTLKLPAEKIPAVGTKPADTYKAGAWDTEPKADTVITEDVTYTYTYAKKTEISATVTFKVVNGSWDDGTTEDKTVTLEGYEGDTLKLPAEKIPAVGSKPADTCKAGAWDTEPKADTVITEDVTYTYTYAKKDGIKATVTFKVVNGSWDDGTAEDKVVSLKGHEGDTLKLKAEDIPAVGTKPAEGYEAGAWDTVPAADKEITADSVYTYTYAEKAPEPEPEPEPIPKGGILLPVISKVQKTAMTVSWNKIKSAEGYEVFYGPCGEDSHNAKVIRVSAKKTGCRLKNLKKKGVKSYKVWVRAYVVREGERIPISTSLKVDSFMKGASAVFTNPKSVSLGTKQIPLAVGKTAKITASVKKEESGKRLTPHLPELRYVSSNTGVASVAEDGTVKGVGNGKCKVYVIAPNGIYKAVQVTVGVKAEKLSFTEKQVKVKAGEELDLRMLLKAEPKGAYLELKWESKDTKIAKVGKDGVVKGRKKGKTKITVEDKASGLKATILVIVTD